MSCSSSWFILLALASVVLLLLSIRAKSEQTRQRLGVAGGMLIAMFAGAQLPAVFLGC